MGAIELWAHLTWFAVSRTAAAPVAFPRHVGRRNFRLATDFDAVIAAAAVAAAAAAVGAAAPPTATIMSGIQTHNKSPHAAGPTKPSARCFQRRVRLLHALQERIRLDTEWHGADYKGRKQPADALLS